MNPSSGESISTPAPNFEALPPAEGPERQPDKEREPSGQSESGAGKHQPAALPAPVPPMPLDIPAAGPVAIPTDVTQDDTPVPGADFHEAHDSHRIEAQWVDRAKKVIAQTKDDPHAQKQKMSQVKAEYIRKRFNKTIPTDNSAAK